MKSLTKVLLHLKEYQEKIMLVYHPTPQSYWNDRCYFLDTNYSPHKKYNHRSVLDNEVVIEYDTDSKELNKELVFKVSRLLASFELGHSIWFSGGKSYHLHLFYKDYNYSPSLMKRAFMEFFCNPLCDVQLSYPNHLIRCEFGIHEKTGNFKQLLYTYKGVHYLNEVPEGVLHKYNNTTVYVYNNESSEEINKELLEDEFVKTLLNPFEFKKFKDGKERGLFCLIHLLKTNKTQEETIKILQEWYGVLGGDIASIPHKVRYQWNKTYIVKRILNDLKAELGYVYKR